VAVVLLERDHDVVVEEASVWRRVRTHLLAARWDRDLAAGVSPDTSVEHSLRAQHLATPAQRTVTASALWRCLDGAARRPRRPVAPRSGPCPLRCGEACSRAPGRSPGSQRGWTRPRRSLRAATP